VPIIVEVIVMQSPLELIVTVVSHFWIAIDWPELIVLRVVVDPVTKILLVAGAVSEGGLYNLYVGIDVAVELDEVRTELDGIIDEPTELDELVKHDEVTTELGETTELDKATGLDEAPELEVVEHNDVVSELDKATELDEATELEVVEHDEVVSELDKATELDEVVEHDDVVSKLDEVVHDEVVCELDGATELDDVHSFFRKQYKESLLWNGS
jgi:hypothetical protein